MNFRRQLRQTDVCTFDKARKSAHARRESIEDRDPRYSRNDPERPPGDSDLRSSDVAIRGRVKLARAHCFRSNRFPVSYRVINEPESSFLEHQSHFIQREQERKRENVWLLENQGTRGHEKSSYDVIRLLRPNVSIGEATNERRAM